MTAVAPANMTLMTAVAVERGWGLVSTKHEGYLVGGW